MSELKNPGQSSEPRLLVGWRKGKRLRAVEVPLHEDVTPELRKISERAVGAVGERKVRSYEQTAELEKGEEYFLFSIEDLPSPPARRRAHPQLHKAKTDDHETLADVADLVALLRAPHLEEISASQLKEGSFQFYAIVWSQAGAPTTAYIKKADPVRTLRRGQVYLLQYGDTLRKTEKPDLVLYDTIDLIVSDTKIYALDQRAFQDLFNDVKLLLQDVPSKVLELTDVLATDAPLQPSATASLLSACGKRVTYAARLRALHPRLVALNVTGERVREVLDKHEYDPKLLLDGENRFDFGEDQAGLFLDVMEGRWFEDDFSGEPRRADRYSTRK